MLCTIWSNTAAAADPTLHCDGVFIKRILSAVAEDGRLTGCVQGGRDSGFSLFSEQAHDKSPEHRP